MSTPVICAYARTPFGRFRGALANYTAVELGTLAVKGVLQRVLVYRCIIQLTSRDLAVSFLLGAVTSRHTAGRFE